MTDYPRDFQPDHCLLCDGAIVGEQKWRRVDGGLVHMTCWMDETQPETRELRELQSSEGANG